MIVGSIDSQVTGFASLQPVLRGVTVCRDGSFP
jgi:hypothetical protein